MAGKKKPGIPVKGINIKLRMINDLIDVTGSAKDSWNPAEISDDMKAIAYIHDLADTWNPAQLNEALKYLGFATIDSWNPAIIEETKNKLVKYFLPTNASGNPIELDLKGAFPYEATSLTIALLPIQDLSHGDPSPTNICPISGRSSVEVKRTGVNQWDEEWESGGYNSSGEKVAWSGAIRSKNTISVLPNTAYYCKYSGATSFYVCWYTDNSFIERVSINASGVVTSPSNATKMTFCTQNNYGDTYNNNISINYPSTDTAYHAYQGETHTHQYSETIYGGVDDFVNGGATSTMGMVDLGDLTWTYYTAGDNPIFYASISDTKIYERYESIESVKCSNYKNSGTANQRTALTSLLANGDFSFISGTTNVVIRDDNYTSATDFKTDMDGVQLCYELATPTELTTSAEQISLLKGINVLSTDGDTINITYKAILNS